MRCDDTSGCERLDEIWILLHEKTISKLYTALYAYVVYPKRLCGLEAILYTLNLICDNSIDTVFLISFDSNVKGSNVLYWINKLN